MPRDSLRSAASYLNSFHDGCIVEVDFGEHDSITLKIEILYLAQGVAGNMRSFYLAFTGATLIRFDPWADEDEPAIETSCEDALNQSCEVLSAEVEDDMLCLHLSQPNNQHGYSGGTLYFSLTGVACRDELGSGYPAAALADIADDYWRKWGREMVKARYNESLQLMFDLPSVFTGAKTAASNAAEVERYTVSP